MEFFLSLGNFLRKFFRGFHKGYIWAKKYNVFYLFLGLFAPKKTYKETENRYRYGIIVCARNEEKVIGNLIDSINSQLSEGIHRNICCCRQLHRQHG